MRVQASTRASQRTGEPVCVYVSGSVVREWLVAKGTDPDPTGIAPTVRFSVPFLLDRSRTGVATA